MSTAILFEGGSSNGGGYPPGSRVLVVGDDGRKFQGTIRVRSVVCGKPNCTKCPHSKYAYVRYRDGGKVKEKYIGVAR